MVETVDLTGQSPNFFDLVRGSEFLVAPALHFLLDRKNRLSRLDESRLVASGFIGWMLAPLDITVSRSFMLEHSVSVIRKRSQPFFSAKQLDLGDESIYRREIAAFAQLAPENRWLLDVFEQLGGYQEIERLAFEQAHRWSRDDLWRRAKRVSRVVHMLHYHAAHLSPLGPLYGPPSPERARKAKAHLSKGTSDKVSAATLHRADWLPRKRSASWLYALMTTTIGPASSGVYVIDSSLQSGAAVSLLATQLIDIAGRCRYVEEEIFSQLYYGNQSDRPARTVFPTEVKSVEFQPTPVQVDPDLRAMLKDNRVTPASHSTGNEGLKS